jgi:D-alanyl-D-alanine carboxypeptidase/D-alanyl-D-alanine-endopeptidase (penicillin-binding protein 4)
VSVTTTSAAASAPVLGKVTSPPIAKLVEQMLQTSDNVIAEMLARQVAVARNMPASFAGAAEATRDALAELDIPVDGFGLVDGSGMSHANRLSAGLLTAIVVRAASQDQPKLRAVISGMPVAGYSGTLSARYTAVAAGKGAAGVVRAKTGTLTGVTALAGLAVDADGRLLAFSLLADGAKNSYDGQFALDRVAAAIAACGCG